MENIYYTLYYTFKYTPIWVYFILAYLLFIGIKSSKPRTLSLKKLFIMPLVFTSLSIHTLLTAFKVDIFSIGIWTFAIIAGALLGWLQVYSTSIKVDRTHYLIAIPGSWTTLIIILIIFTTKYYFSYQLAVDPALATQTFFEFLVLAVSGACTGLFVGRLLTYLYRFKTLPSTHLRLKS